MNKVELKDLVPGAIVVTANGSLAIITGPNPRSSKYPILYKVKSGSRGYKGSASDFKVVLGVVDRDKYNEAEGPKAPDVEEMDVPDFMKPAELKGVKIGDKIIIRQGYNKEREVEYRGYKSNRPKYPLSYRLPTGGNYKAAMSVFVKAVEVKEVA